MAGSPNGGEIPRCGPQPCFGVSVSLTIRARPWRLTQLRDKRQEPDPRFSPSLIIRSPGGRLRSSKKTITNTVCKACSNTNRLPATCIGDVPGSAISSNTAAAGRARCPWQRGFRHPQPRFCAPHATQHGPPAKGMKMHAAFSVMFGLPNSKSISNRVARADTPTDRHRVCPSGDRFSCHAPQDNCAWEGGASRIRGATPPTLGQNRSCGGHPQQRALGHERLCILCQLSLAIVPRHTPAPQAPSQSVFLMHYVRNCQFDL